MAEVLSTATVTLNRAQRDICCELLYDEIRDGITRDDAGHLRLFMAGARLFEAVEWRNDDPDRDAWTFDVDGEIAWLVEEFFEPFSRELAAPWLEENPEPTLPAWVDTEEDRKYWADWFAHQAGAYRALIAGTEAILGAVA
jgi:hypothetical protein